jgi:hypothetical protein
MSEQSKPGAHLCEEVAKWLGYTPAGSTWRHKRSGRCITVAMVSLCEETLRPLITYYQHDSGVPFTRPAVFFHDGRFERLYKV